MDTEKKSSSSFTALVSVIVGLLLILWHGDNSFLRAIVMVIGGLIAVVALFAFIAQIAQKKGEKNYGWIALAVLAFIVGLWLLCDSQFFISFVIYVLAVVIILAGVWHMWSLSVFHKNYKVPFWLWVIPAILVVAGLWVMFTGARVAASAIVLIAGIALILSGLNSFFETVNRMRHRDDMHQAVEGKDTAALPADKTDTEAKTTGENPAE